MGKEELSPIINTTKLSPLDYTKRVADRFIAVLEPVFKQDGVWLDQQVEIQRLARGGYGRSVALSFAIVEALEKSFLVKPCAQLVDKDGKGRVLSYEVGLLSEEAVLSNAMDSLFVTAVYRGKEEGYDFNQWELIRRNVYGTFASRDNHAYKIPQGMENLTAPLSTGRSPEKKS